MAAQERKHTMAKEYKLYIATRHGECIDEDDDLFELLKRVLHSHAINPERHHGPVEIQKNIGRDAYDGSTIFTFLMRTFPSGTVTIAKDA
jgi:hypothetical protein